MILNYKIIHLFMEDHNNIPELYRKVIYFIVEKSQEGWGKVIKNLYSAKT